MEDRKEILKRLDKVWVCFLSLNLDNKPLTEQSVIQDIVNDNYIDSLDCVEIAMNIEKEFSISIPDDEISSCRTIGDMIDVIIKVGKEIPEEIRNKRFVYCSAIENLANIANALITEDVAFNYTSSRIFFGLEKGVWDKIKYKYSCLLHNVVVNDSI